MSIYTPRLSEYVTRVEAALAACLPPATGRDGITSEVMAYACSAGGKRLRPVLTMEWARLCGADPETALPFACALEMIHCYSLVHDDLPCMDNSPLRRGKPSAHAAYGETIALLAGDALLNRAFEICLDPRLREEIPAENRLRAAWELADAAGIRGMIGGQTIDLVNEGKTIDIETLSELHRKKTGALLTVGCRIGAILANADPDLLDRATRYGNHLGLGFQIVDDILDATATAEQLGKPVGADAENEKTTYVTLFGEEKARALASQETEAALSELDVFGNKAANLRLLTEKLLTRMT